MQGAARQARPATARQPTNHLDAETVDWLEHQLRDYPGTVIIVTHDRYFLDNVTKWILEIEGGHGVPLGRKLLDISSKLLKMSAGEKKDTRGRALEHELAWIRMSNNDRQQFSRSRLQHYEQLVAREAAASKQDNAVITVAPGPELGDDIIEFKNVTKQFGDQVFKDASFMVPKAAIVGIVGPNGTGKTTMMRMIVGKETPDAGELKIGSTVQLSYVDQERSSFEGKEFAR